MFAAEPAVLLNMISFGVYLYTLTYIFPILLSDHLFKHMNSPFSPSKEHCTSQVFV